MDAHCSSSTSVRCGAVVAAAGGEGDPAADVDAAVPDDDAPAAANASDANSPSATNSNATNANFPTDANATNAEVYE